MFNFDVEIKPNQDVWVFDPFGDDRLHPDLKSWLDECTLGRWYASPLYNERPFRLVMRFECLEDAVAFKLRWA